VRIWPRPAPAERAAEAAGIDTFRVKLAALAASAFATALGGTVYAQYYSFIGPETVAGVPLSIRIAAAAAIGGMGTRFGPAVGAFLVTAFASGVVTSNGRDFAVRIERMRDENLDFLGRAKAAGKRIYGLGAPVKGNTLLNYFGVGTQYLDCLVERNPLRGGLVSPGMHIPVVLEAELPAPPDLYYVLAWNFKDEILARYAALQAQGVEFYFPVNPKDV